MKVFHVYQHPVRGYEAVKQGWSWPGFFFGFIWALGKRMWGLSALILIVGSVLGIIEFSLTGFSVISTLLVWIVVGLKANVWRQSALVKLGFERIKTVPASTKDAAIASTANE